MKKLALAILLLTLTASFAYAEIGAQTYTNKLGQRFDEMQSFVYAVNNSGTNIASNRVVILDTTAANVASNSTLGAYITTTTTANDPLFVGVTDQAINNGSGGKVCVRGPHKAYVLTTTGTLTAGASLSTNTTAGSFARPAVATPVYAQAALLSGTQTYDNSTATLSKDESSLYWVYIKGN